MRAYHEARRARRVRPRRISAHKIDVDDDMVTAIIDAVGSDLRELAAVCSQLVADTDGAVDATAVRRYYSGRAEVKGFDIADKAVWAMSPVRSRRCDGR